MNKLSPAERPRPRPQWHARFHRLRLRRAAKARAGARRARPELFDVEIVHILTFGAADYAKGDLLEHFRHNAFFVGPNVREAVNEGSADYTPIFLSEIPRSSAAAACRSMSRWCR
jgi:acyl-CoA hydrolase